MRDIESAKATAETARAEYFKRLGHQQLLTQEKLETEKTIVDLEARTKLCDETIVLLQKSSEAARDQAKQYLQNLVTTAIQHVSGIGYAFEIDLTEKGGKPFAEFYIVTDINGNQSRQLPQDACGGGFVDVIATTLRFAYMEILASPNMDGFVMLDEPGKMISEAASIRFSQFVKQMGTMFDRQILMISHNESLQLVADTTYVAALDGNMATQYTKQIDMNMEDILNEQIINQDEGSVV